MSNRQRQPFTNPVALGKVTSANAVTETVFSADIIRSGDVAVVTAGESGAAAHFGSAGGVYVTVAAGMVTISHPSSAATDVYHVAVFPNPL